MAIRTALLSSRNVNLDSDFSKYIETISEPWVIEGFALANSKIGLWKARVPCERTNWETIYALVQNFSEVSLDTSWSGYIIISIPQNIIDDWSLWNEDWTWIATIEVVSSLPSKNYLELYSLSSWEATDERNMIKKIWELNTAIESMQEEIDDLDERVEALEVVKAIDHLEEMEVVWEKYSLSNTLYAQTINQNSSSAIIEANVWDVAANTEIHIQRIWSWVWNNSITFKAKKVWSPTTSVVFEVRKWIKVDVSSSEAYWYWDEENIIATWTLSYSDFSSDWADITVSFDNNFWLEEWELLSVVIYQTNWSTKIVNDSNYFCFACYSTEWSECFDYVKVNWWAKSRTKLIPVCASSWFASKAFAREWADINLSLWQIEYQDNVEHPLNRNGYTYTFIAPHKWTFVMNATWRTYRYDWNYNDYVYYTISVNWVEKEKVNRAWTGTLTESKTYNLEKWDVFTVFTNQMYSDYNRDYVALVVFSTFSITCTTCYLEKKWDKKLIPTEVVWVWEKTAATLFWLLKDWTFWRDDPSNIPVINSADYQTTTFDITAYKGYVYIEIWGYKYKVPYVERYSL